MTKKIYISAQQLLDDSFQLALEIFESGYRPDYIVGVWRGGAPVGIAVQELLEVLGVRTDHIAIRTASYTGIGERKRDVEVHGLNYIASRVKPGESILIVDDIHDTGLSIQQVSRDIEATCKGSAPEVKIATPYYNPENNRSDRYPDFYIHQIRDWLVFPHELQGLSLEELAGDKPGIDSIRQALLELKKAQQSKAE